VNAGSSQQAWPGRKNNNQRLWKTDLKQLIMMDHNHTSNIKCTVREQRTDFAPPATFCFDGAEIS
jgi:hypothetical protein